MKILHIHCGLRRSRSPITPCVLSHLVIDESAKHHADSNSIVTYISFHSDDEYSIIYFSKFDLNDMPRTDCCILSFKTEFLF